MYERELEKMIAAALAAEKKILEVYATDFSVETKSDDSPVTAADKGADKIIREVLGKAFPEYGFLTEESADTKDRLSKKAIFVVDPVDGTKEFVAKNEEFATNIALVVDHHPVVGVIHIPCKGLTYYAIKGQGAFKRDKEGTVVKIHVSEKIEDLTALKSRCFLDPREVALIEKHADKIKHSITLGAALKFCRIAEGGAEISYRVSACTKEWDTAAGDIILTEAGGLMWKPDGKPYEYNREDVYNREGYILANKKENFLV